METNYRPTRRGFRASRHAAERFRERFAGNVTLAEAAKRVESISRTARRKRPAPGGATVYGTHGYEMIVRNDVIITVYGADTRPVPYALEA